jgi:hypothetical protein
MIDSTQAKRSAWGSDEFARTWTGMMVDGDEAGYKRERMKRS